MNKILLIDVDSVIPNLALMKLSTFYKNKGFNVELIKCNISYYPKKTKKCKITLDEKYYKVFVSCIFNNTLKLLVINDNYNNDIEYGGSGVNLTTNLSNDVYNCELDYSIYPENEFSYGFITRGCIRNCYFCIVPRKEGVIHFEKHPKDIIKHKKVKFLDNNILAYEDHYKILEWLVQNKIKYQFNQGLDIRLLNKQNSELLKNSKYIGEYVFAFDNIKYKQIIEEKIKLLKWRNDWKLKFFVYVNPNMKLKDTIERIMWIKNNKCLPYIMRDLTCWGSEFCDFYTDLAAYCNQPHMFKKMDFKQFLNKRYTNQERINFSNNLFYN